MWKWQWRLKKLKNKTEKARTCKTQHDGPDVLGPVYTYPLSIRAQESMHPFLRLVFNRFHFKTKSFIQFTAFRLHFYECKRLKTLRKLGSDFQERCPKWWLGLKPEIYRFRVDGKTIQNEGFLRFGLPSTPVNSTENGAFRKQRFNIFDHFFSYACGQSSEKRMTTYTRVDGNFWKPVFKNLIFRIKTV